MKGIILGNNISGLIWGFYHPSYEVWAPIQDSQVRNQYTHSNMVWLHDTFETRQLCIDLGYTYEDLKPRRANIGYYNNGFVSEVLTKDLSVKLIAKKMSLWNEPISISETGSTKLSMTSEDSVSFMNVIGIDTADILKRLQKKVKVTHGYAVGITDKLVAISDRPSGQSGHVWVSYDALISTLPAPVFWGMWSENKYAGPIRKFNSLPITNIITNIRPSLYDDRYEMIYYDESVAWTRASFINGKYGLEFTGKISEEDLQSIYPLDISNISDMFTVPGGRLIPQHNESPRENIIFSGRFAEWDHNITTEHVVYNALKHN